MTKCQRMKNKNIRKTETDELKRMKSKKKENDTIQNDKCESKSNVKEGDVKDSYGNNENEICK